MDIAARCARAERTAAALVALSRARLDRPHADELLDLIVQAARVVLDASVVAVAVAAEPVDTGDVDPVVRAIEGGGGSAADLDELLASRERHVASHGIVLPVRAGGRHLGVIAAVRDGGQDPFDEDDVAALEAFAAEAFMALEFGEIREELDRLALLEERERIAMELHDGVVQALFVVGLSLRDEEVADDDLEQMRARMSHAVDAIDATIRNLRDYIFALRPTEFADRHLARALRDLADMAERSGRVRVNLQIDPQAATALAARTSTVVQAAREAVSNAIQHSEGNAVNLRFVTLGSSVVLEVTDNGNGFSVDEVDGTGQGLANLRTRAHDLGGNLAIDSEPGRGTAVRITVPI